MIAAQQSKYRTKYFTKHCTFAPFMTCHDLKSFQSSATLQLHATLPLHAVLCAMDVLWLLWLRYMRYAAVGLVDDIGITVRICQELLDGLFGLEHSWSGTAQCSPAQRKTEQTAVHNEQNNLGRMPHVFTKEIFLLGSRVNRLATFSNCRIDIVNSKEPQGHNQAKLRDSLYMSLYIFILTNAILLRHGLGTGRFPFLPGRLYVGAQEPKACRMRLNFEFLGALKFEF